MSFEAHAFYPGESATPLELVALADMYRGAAQAVRPSRDAGGARASAPYRLLALHAVELYLNAALLDLGRTPGQLRALHHDLAARIGAVGGSGLVLRKRTAAHLRSVQMRREYLTARYDPAGGASELNRMAATLDEVAAKVRVRIDEAERARGSDPRRPAASTGALLPAEPFAAMPGA